MLHLQLPCLQRDTRSLPLLRGLGADRSQLILNPMDWYTVADVKSSVVVGHRYCLQGRSKAMYMYLSKNYNASYRLEIRTCASVLLAKIPPDKNYVG